MPEPLPQTSQQLQERIDKLEKELAESRDLSKKERDELRAELAALKGKRKEEEPPAPPKAEPDVEADDRGWSPW